MSIQKVGRQEGTVSKSAHGKVKRVDDRVRNVIEKTVAENHRSLIVLVGDESKTQVMNLHYMLTRARGASDNELSILWCMKNELAFGGMSRKRRLEQNKKEKLSGRIVSENTHENFESFLSQANIRYCYYKETKKVLGNTFDMTILQDFEGLTPNVIARVVEATSGKGMVLLMIRTLASLEMLHGLTHVDAINPGRGSGFHSRLLRSLADCRSFLCVDDGLNILPITKGLKTLQAPVPGAFEMRAASLGKKLDDLKLRISNAQPGTLASLCGLTSTYDQGVTFLTLAKCISSQSMVNKKDGLTALSQTVAITSNRGRGKSAALGLAIAFALQNNFKSVCIFAPCLDNLVSLFEFLVRGLRALNYSEHADFTRIYGKASDDGDFLSAIHFFGKKCHQSVEFMQPKDALIASKYCSTTFKKCDLLVFDEGAALPIDLLQLAMQQSTLTMLSSTVAGYEGSGRSLAVKVLKSFESPMHSSFSETDVVASGSTLSEQPKSPYQHIELHEPIRYSMGDPVEEWLHKLLCLPMNTLISSASSADDLPTLQNKPHPDRCQLLHIPKESLFSYSATAEKYLRRIMLTLFHAHYRNQPDDLQTLCDSPNHHILVLTGPSRSEISDVPDILCVLQVVQEGGVSSEEASSCIRSGSKPSGNMIPYTLSQYYDNSSLAAHRGLRIIRIATHPEAQSSGYGTRAVSLLARSIVDPKSMSQLNFDGENTDKEMTYKIFDGVEYLGVMFGATSKLFQFWSRSNFFPVYLRQTQSDITGEHSLLMLYDASGSATIAQFSKTMKSMRAEFTRRYISLVPSIFREIPIELSVMIAMQHPTDSMSSEEGIKQLCHELRPNDVSRLNSFRQLKCDYGLIADLVPRIARLFFTGSLLSAADKGLNSSNENISALSLTVFMGVGLHGYSFDELMTTKPLRESSLSIFQLRTLLTQAIESFTRYISKAVEKKPKSISW